MYQESADHIGAVMTYLADCGGSCATADASKLKWVKVSALFFLDLRDTSDG